jgi:hypothetical protein
MAVFAEHQSGERIGPVLARGSAASAEVRAGALIIADPERHACRTLYLPEYESRRYAAGAEDRQRIRAMGRARIGSDDEERLRVGSYRVVYIVEADLITVSWVDRVRA